MRDLMTLPKADLHCHLEGCARPATIAELAGKYGMTVGDSQNFTDLASFLDRYDDARSVIRSIEDLERIAREFVQDQVASGSVYCEPDWAPHFYTDLTGLTSKAEEEKIEEVFVRVDRAMQDTASESGIEFGHSIGTQRSDPVLSVKIAHFAVEHRDQRVVSFGYGGDEARAPHGPLRPAAKIITQSGLLFVPHAGEVLGAESVAEVIDMGARRVAHGVRSVEDPLVVQRLVENGIACDVTLHSNIRLGIYKDLARHPLKQMIEAGIPVTLNTDDSLFFGASLLDEYRAARRMGIDDERLAQIARNSIRFSGLPEASKQRHLVKIDEWIAA